MSFFRLQIADKAVNESKRIFTNIKPDDDSYDFNGRFAWVEKQYSARRDFYYKVNEIYENIYGFKFALLAGFKYLLITLCLYFWLDVNGLILGIIVSFLLRRIDILEIRVNNVNDLLVAEVNKNVLLKEMIDIFKKREK